MAPPLKVGSRVRLHGLCGRPELNSRLGKVLRHVKDSGRWKVALDGEADAASSLALKAENLQVLPGHADALARTVLACRQRAGATRGPGAAGRLRTVHVVGAAAWELGLQYGGLLEAAQQRPGDRVTLSGLSARPDLNGAVGTLERFVPEKGRWKVILAEGADGQGHGAGSAGGSAPSSGAGFVLKPENLLPAPLYRHEGFQGTWLQDGDRHTVFVAGGSEGAATCGKCIGPDGELVEDITVLGPDSFSMTVDGESLTATLSSDGATLAWSDGDAWVRPSAWDDALIRVVLIGPELPDELPAEQLSDIPGGWPEPGVHVVAYRGSYERFVASAEYSAPEVVFLPSPGFAPSGVAPGFFAWCPALHALASLSAAGTADGEGEGEPREAPLCCCSGAEPYGDGEWLGDAVYDEQVLRALGFDVIAPPARNAAASLADEHPTSGWHQWAFTMVFAWRADKPLPPLDAWTWAGYYSARRSRCELPRFRFRPPAPALKPPALSDFERRCSEGAAGDGGDDEEALQILAMEWVGATARVAWLRGGGACPAAAAGAAAVATAEEFADRTRSRPLPPNQEHVVASGASELAAKVAASTSVVGGEVGVEPPSRQQRAVAAAAAVAVVTVFEALAQEALWSRRGSLTPELIGHLAAVALQCAEREGAALPSGAASAVGQRCADALELLGGGPHRPPVGRLAEEFAKLADGACESAGCNDAGERAAIAMAVVDNLDLAIPAQGGRDASLRISLKMHDAPPCRRGA